jgi:hypothetical protein
MAPQLLCALADARSCPECARRSPARPAQAMECHEYIKHPNHLNVTVPWRRNHLQIKHKTVCMMRHSRNQVSHISPVPHQRSVMQRVPLWTRTPAVPPFVYSAPLLVLEAERRNRRGGGPPTAPGLPARIAATSRSGTALGPRTLNGSPEGEGEQAACHAKRQRSDQRIPLRPTVIPPEIYFRFDAHRWPRDEMPSDQAAVKLHQCHLPARSVQ